MLKWFKRKRVVLTNNEKIESYRGEIQGVFSQFKEMNEKLDSVNENLQIVIEDEKFAKEVEQERLEKLIEDTNKRLAESDSLIEKAHNEIKTNEKLQEKVKEFIVG